MKIPILILGFNRPYFLEKVLENLLGYVEGPIFVSIDGPRNVEPTYLDEIKHQKYILEKYSGFVDLQWKINRVNKGCFRGVVSGIDWFFGINARGIILEDDLILNRDTLDFLAKGLEFYQHRKEIAAINVFRFINSGSDSLNLSNYASSWGWATWKNRWDDFIYDTSKISNWFLLKSLVDRFTLEEIYHWIVIKKKLELGQIDSWAYRWLLSNLIHNKKFIIPPRNLIRNVGFDLNSTHTTDASIFNQNIADINIQKWQFEANLRLDANYESYLRENVYGIRSKRELIKRFFN